MYENPTVTPITFCTNSKIILYGDTSCNRSWNHWSWAEERAQWVRALAVRGWGQELRLSMPSCPSAVTLCTCNPAADTEDGREAGGPVEFAGRQPGPRTGSSGLSNRHCLKRRRQSSTDKGPRYQASAASDFAQWAVALAPLILFDMGSHIPQDSPELAT